MRAGYEIFIRNRGECGVCVELHLLSPGDCGELEFFLRHGIEAVKKEYSHLNNADPQKLCDALKEGMKRNSP